MPQEISVSAKQAKQVMVYAKGKAMKSMYLQDI
jgi:hypothetical protein